LRKIPYVKEANTNEEMNVMSNAGRGVNLQDHYLNQLRKEKIPVVIYLTNGVRLKGLIKAFDNFVILLKESNQSLVYKHAISTIVPEKEVSVVFEDQP
jgi:host factor-I protein